MSSPGNGRIRALDSADCLMRVAVGDVRILRRNDRDFFVVVRASETDNQRVPVLPSGVFSLQMTTIMPKTCIIVYEDTKKSAFVAACHQLVLPLTPHPLPPAARKYASLDVIKLMMKMVMLLFKIIAAGQTLFQKIQRDK
jgi:hypothetical protein